MHANIGGDAGQHQVLDAARAQDQLEVGRAERALAWLVDDGFPRRRGELVDDVPAGLAAHQNLAAGAGVADAGADLARAPALVVGQVREVGAMALARVDDMVALVAHRGEQRLDRLDRRARQREIVAHAVDISALAAEVGLHVDDDQRRIVGAPVAVIGPGIGIGLDRRHVYSAAFATTRSQLCVRSAFMAQAPLHFAMDSSPGMSRAERVVLEVAIMRASVRI